MQDHIEGMGGRTAAEAQKQRMAPTADSSGLKPVSRDTGPAQGSLNIEAPAKPSAEGSDDLDIPAFLRRQAN